MKQLVEVWDPFSNIHNLCFKRGSEQRKHGVQSQLGGLLGRLLCDVWQSDSNLIPLKPEITSALLLSANLHGKSLQGKAEWFVSVRSVTVKTTGSFVLLDAELLECVLFCMLHAVFDVTQLAEGLIYRYARGQEQDWLHVHLL